MIGVPLVLVLTVAWQIGSSVLRTDMDVPEAVAVGRVSLEPDALGSRIDFVLVDSVGQATTIDGLLNVSLREPDGTLWQTSRTVSASDFQALPEGSLLAGRNGYSVVIPATDWARPPRRGGEATVTINVQPSDGSPPFTSVAQALFP